MAPHPSKIEPRAVPGTEGECKHWVDGKLVVEHQTGIFIEPNVDTTCFSIRQLEHDEDAMELSDDLIHFCSWPELRMAIDRFMDDRAAEAGPEAVAELEADYLAAGIIRRPT